MKPLNLLFSLISLTSACNIAFTVRSISNERLQFEAEIPKIREISKRVELAKFGQEANVTLPSSSCENLLWTFRTFKPDADNAWSLAQSSTARLDGRGRVLLIVDFQRHISIADRWGVSCSESMICSRG